MIAMISSDSNMEDPPMLPVPSRNPLPLSAAQEAQVREVYYSRVRGYCATEIKAFADCAMGRTFSAPFFCRSQRLDMNNCMTSHATQAEQDAAREEWFAMRLKRRKEREAKEQRRKEQEKFHREWWGLKAEERNDESDRGSMHNVERVGGFPKRNNITASQDRPR